MLAAALETRLAVTRVASPLDRRASARFLRLWRWNTQAAIDPFTCPGCDEFLRRICHRALNSVRRRLWSSEELFVGTEHPRGDAATLLQIYFPSIDTLRSTSRTGTNASPNSSCLLLNQGEPSRGGCVRDTIVFAVRESASGSPLLFIEDGAP